MPDDENCRKCLEAKENKAKYDRNKREDHEYKKKERVRRCKTKHYSKIAGTYPHKDKDDVDAPEGITCDDDFLPPHIAKDNDPLFNKKSVFGKTGFSLPSNWKDFTYVIYAKNNDALNSIIRSSSPMLWRSNYEKILLF